MCVCVQIFNLTIRKSKQRLRSNKRNPHGECLNLKSPEHVHSHFLREEMDNQECYANKRCFKLSVSQGK